MEEQKQTIEHNNNITSSQKTASTIPNWIIIGFILCIVLMVGSIGYLWYQNMNLKQMIEQTNSGLQTDGLKPDTNQLSPENPSLTPIRDLTDNWLSYSNSNISYTFKYPGNVKIEEENRISLILWGPTQKEATELYDGLYLSFSLPFQLESVSLKDYVNDQIKSSEEHVSEIIKPLESITIGDLYGYTYTARGLGEFQYIFLQSKDKVWTVEIIDGTNDPSNQGFQDIVQKILSTFRFTQ